MSYKLYRFSRAILLSCFCFLSLSAVFLGLFFGLMETPKAQSLRYLEQAEKYAAQSTVGTINTIQTDLYKYHNMTLTAFFYDPYNQEIWKSVKEAELKVEGFYPLEKKQGPQVALSFFD